jgi:hypothetical protein
LQSTSYGGGAGRLLYKHQREDADKLYAHLSFAGGKNAYEFTLGYAND